MNQAYGTPLGTAPRGGGLPLAQAQEWFDESRSVKVGPVIKYVGPLLPWERTSKASGINVDWLIPS